MQPGNLIRSLFLMAAGDKKKKETTWEKIQKWIKKNERTVEILGGVLLAVVIALVAYHYYEKSRGGAGLKAIFAKKTTVAVPAGALTPTL